MIDLAAPIRSWMPPVLYVGARAGLPRVLMARWPAELRQPTPYKTWICETAAELAQVQARLDRPVPVVGGRLDFLRGPDGALGPGRGAKPHGEMVVALYQPPEPGWPWLVLSSPPTRQAGWERDRYAWEAFDTEAVAVEYIERLGLDVGRIKARITTAPSYS